jgi:PiT family inorganic phosphate transporter
VAETSSAAVILASAHLGFALSTTQVTAGSVFGAGAARQPGAVRWAVARRLAIAWLVTLPAAAAMGAAAARVAASGAGGMTLVAAAAGGLALVIFAISRRRPVTAASVIKAPDLMPTPAPAHEAA